MKQQYYAVASSQGMWDGCGWTGRGRNANWYVGFGEAAEIANKAAQDGIQGARVVERYKREESWT